MLRASTQHPTLSGRCWRSQWFQRSSTPCAEVLSSPAKRTYLPYICLFKDSLGHYNFRDSLICDPPDAWRNFSWSSSYFGFPVCSSSNFLIEGITFNCLLTIAGLPKSLSADFVCLVSSDIWTFFLRAVSAYSTCVLYYHGFDNKRFSNIDEKISKRRFCHEMKLLVPLVSMEGNTGTW